MKNMTTISIITLAFFMITILKVQSVEFQVGGDKGWVIPPSNDTNHYNEWASRNRFNINNTLHFVYKKDSVLVVTKEEHENCISSNPVFFSNDGDTTSFVLNRAGYFYFISGVFGHCERGLKMIIKVLERENVVDPTVNETSTQSEAMSILKMDGDTSSQILMIVGILSMFTVFYM